MRFPERLLRASSVVLSLAIKPVLAQSEPETIHNFTFWGGFEMYTPWREHSSWGLFLEGYAKRKDMVDPMAWFWKIGGTYYFKNEDRFSLGVAYQYNYPYDDAMLPYEWPDWRVWQQHMIRRPSKKNHEHLWVHRFRLEERWLGRLDDGNSTTANGWDYYKFELTFRYMLRSQWYLTKRFAIAVYDEPHLRLASSKHGENLLDQNRIYAGVVFALNDKREWRIETGYMNQAIFNAVDEKHIKVRVNHTWRLTLTADVAIFAPKEKSPPKTEEN